MILSYLLFFIIGIATFIIANKKSLRVRIALSLGIFIILSVIATIIVLSIGDEPLPGSYTVYPNKAEEKLNSQSANAEDIVKKELMKRYDEGYKAGSNWSVYWDLKEWAIAFEKYYKANKEYPTSASVEELRTMLTPYQNAEFGLRILDPWEDKYLINSSKDEYIISSKGEDKNGGHEFGGAIDPIDYNYSTTLRNGKFVQYLKARFKTVHDFEAEIQAVKKDP
jgi:hypothetical protein